MGRTTHARRTRERARTSRALHLRAASVIAVAALGIGAAPAIAGTVDGDSSQHATTESGSDGGTSDSPTATSTSGASAEPNTESDEQSTSTKSSEQPSGTTSRASSTDAQGEKSADDTDPGSRNTSNSTGRATSEKPTANAGGDGNEDHGKLTVPESVEVGATQVTVSGEDFPTSKGQADVWVTVDDGSSGKPQHVHPDLDGGVFSNATVGLPGAARAGAEYTVHATAGDSTVTERFTVKTEGTPTLALDRYSATAGEEAKVTATISGFSKKTDVTARLAGGKKSVEVGHRTTDENGEATIELTVPRATPVGKYTIVVASGGDGQAESATRNFKVEKAEGAAKPTISLASDESTVQPGSHLTVQAEDFPNAGASVTLQDAKTGTQIGTLATVAKSDVNDGAFSAPVTIPANTASGEYTILAASNSRNASAKLPVTVKASQGSSDGGGDDESDGGVGAGNGSGTGSDTSTDTGSANSPSSPTTGSSSPTTSSPSSKDDSSSRSRTSDVPSSSRSRDRSDEIELNSPAEDPASNDEKSDESEKKDDTSTKSEDSSKADDKDTKTSASPQETSDQPVSAQQDQQTEAAATMKDDDPSTGATTVTKDENSDPLVKLFNTIGGQDASGMSRIRQVFVATLGLGFLTALGFTAASWLSRRSGTHSARAGLRQLFHRRH